MDGSGRVYVSLHYGQSTAQGGGQLPRPPANASAGRFRHFVVLGLLASGPPQVAKPAVQLSRERTTSNVQSSARALAEFPQASVGTLSQMKIGAVDLQ